MEKIILLVCCFLLAATVAMADADLPGEMDGAALYREHCARCHGELEQTRIPDRRPARIASAIQHLGAMAGLKSLNALQILAISRALNSEAVSLSSR